MYRCAAASTPCAGARPALCGSAARALIKDLLVCINKHLSGVKALFTPRNKGVVFLGTEWECMPVSCCGVLVCLGSEGTRGEGLQNVFQHTVDS